MPSESFAVKLESCGGGGFSCVNVQADPQKCGTACAGNDYCDGGACVPTCTSAQKLRPLLRQHPDRQRELRRLQRRVRLGLGLPNGQVLADVQQRSDAVRRRRRHAGRRRPLLHRHEGRRKQLRRVRQGIASAFGNPSTPSVGSYAYACAEIASTTGYPDAGQFYCSSDSNCPTAHLTTSDAFGTACGTGAFLSICPCQ